MSIYDDIETMGLRGEDYIAPIADHDEIAAQAFHATSALLQALQDCGLENVVRTIGWGVVNAVHREIERMDKRHDENARTIRDLIHEQDGSEVKDVELQTAMDAQARLEEMRGALVTWRESAADAFAGGAGEPWLARSGSRTGPRVTATMIDARAALKAARDKRHADLNPEGPRFIVTGSLRWTDVDGLFGALDRLHAMHPDMVLVSKDAKGVERIALQWAAIRGVPAIAAPMDWSNKRQTAFKAIGQMFALKPAGVVVFENPVDPINGITKNIIQTAERDRIRIWRPRRRTAAG